MPPLPCYDRTPQVAGRYVVQAQRLGKYVYASAWKGHMSGSTPSFRAAAELVMYRDRHASTPSVLGLRVGPPQREFWLCNAGY